MRSRFTSASTLWNRRSSRRSSGWSTAAARVLRMRAGEGDMRVSDLRYGWSDGSTPVYINGR